MSDVKYDQWETHSTSKVLHKHLHNTVIIKQHQMVQRPNCNFRVFIKNHLVDKYQDCVWRKAAAAHLVFLWETRVFAHILRHCKRCSFCHHKLQIPGHRFFHLRHVIRSQGQACVLWTKDSEVRSLFTIILDRRDYLKYKIWPACACIRSELRIFFSTIKT